MRVVGTLLRNRELNRDQNVSRAEQAHYVCKGLFNELSSPYFFLLRNTSSYTPKGVPFLLSSLFGGIEGQTGSYREEVSL